MIAGLQSARGRGVREALRRQQPGDRPAARERRRRRTAPAGDLSARLRARDPGGHPGRSSALTTASTVCLPAREALLTDVLRDEWGYDGVVISDWGAVHDPVAAVAAGLDLRMPGQPSDPRVGEAFANGSLDDAAIDVVIDRLRVLANRTAESTKTKPVVDYDAHHQLTRQAAAESAVPLHDAGALLPIDPGRVSSVAVIGELARAPRYQGAGSSAVKRDPRRQRPGRLADAHRRVDVGVVHAGLCPLPKRRRDWNG